jgi:NADH dehydrogenase
MNGAIAITGARGFIGQHLCQRFARRGWDVRALVRSPSASAFATPGIRPFACDLPDVIDPDGLRGAQALVHCAYMTRFTDRAAAERVNDVGTRRVIEAARAAGVERFVFLSSQSAHESAESYYGRSKLALEKLFDPARDTILRSGLAIGKAGDGLFHRMCEMVRKARVIPLFGGGRQPIQTIHIEDLCDAVEHAVMRRLAGTYSVSEAGSLEMGQLLREIAARLGRKPIFVPFPIAPALLALRLIEALRIPFPVSSENLLGLKCLRVTDTAPDLVKLGVKARSARESLDEVLGDAGR